MPIYAYRCSACGHAQDVLQKMSAPKLTDCPACGQATYVKQVTAAGFQLKGSGWYVTDFREGNKGASKDKPEASGGAEASADKSASDKSATDKPGAEKATASGGDKASAPPADKAASGSAASPAAPAPAPGKAPSPPPSSSS